jgi:hypothetical protein
MLATILGKDPTAKPYVPSGVPALYYTGLVDEYTRLTTNKTIEVVDSELIIAYVRHNRTQRENVLANLEIYIPPNASHANQGRFGVTNGSLLS